MDQHQRDEWELLVRSAFPPNVEIKVVLRADHFEAIASLPLWTADRRHKRSKTIRLMITMEAINDSSNKPDEKRREQDKLKAAAWIRKKLKSFDPSHDSPINQTNPEEEWIISSDVLNS